MSDLLLMAQSGLPRNGLVALYDPYRDAYGLTEEARLALQTGVDYSGRGNTLTYGATTNASTDDPSNTGTAWSFDGGDYLDGTISSIAANGARSVLIVFSGTTSAVGGNLFSAGSAEAHKAFGLSLVSGTHKLQCYTYTDDLVSNWNSDANNHIACGTYNGSRELSLYYDGNAPVSKTLSGDLNITAATLRVGSTAWLNDFWVGKIFLVAYYSRYFPPIEYFRTQRSLKSLMARRGVTLA